MHYLHKKQVAPRVDFERANAGVKMERAKHWSPTDAGMTVTPATDAAYILPTLERFRNKLLDLTTRNNLLNLSQKSQRTARLLRIALINQQGAQRRLNLMLILAKGVIELATSIEPQQIDLKRNTAIKSFLAAIGTKKMKYSPLRRGINWRRE